MEHDTSSKYQISNEAGGQRTPMYRTIMGGYNENMTLKPCADSQHYVVHWKPSWSRL